MAPSDLASFLAGDPPADGAPPPDAVPDPAPSGPKAAASETVVLNDRFEIEPSRPIPELSHAGADAFGARRTGGSAAELFAYVARSGLPARHDILTAMRAIEHAHLLNLLGHGVAYWPPDGTERLIAVYERPARRLVATPPDGLLRMQEDELVRVLVRPIVGALEALKSLRIVHGAINPGNVFVAPGNEPAVLLGDCVTAPSGFIQPAAFEPIGRAMATPAGRGAATFADDAYALGASMVFLLLGRFPGDGRDLIAARIDSGSYAALVGKASLPPYITEPVRGLLIDDPAQRWTLEDVGSWLGGRRQSPRRAEIAGRLKRAVSFKDVDHTNARSLAAAMADDSAAADRFITEGALEDGLERATDDEDLMSRIAEAKRTATLGRSGSLADRQVARVLMALDPQAPIRYRGIAVMPEGLGAALAEAEGSGQGTQPLAEIIAAQLPMAWLSFQTVKDEGIVPLVRKFDTLSGFVVEREYGYGIERCLYELDASTPCRGRLTEGRQVLDAKSLLAALETVAGRADRPKEPIDRHVAAFLMSRHARLIHEPMTRLAGETGPEQRCAALVDLYDIVQRRAGVSTLPRLCEWLVSLAGPALARYHSRSLRERLTAELQSAWKSGRVHDLKALIGSGPLADRDTRGFRAAVAAHARAKRSIAARRRELERRASIAGALGRQAAAIVASLLSVMMAIGAVIMAVL